MFRVKICGVTRPEDVRMIARAGADAIGFQMSMGPRKITPNQARKLVKLVPPLMTPVGVFVNEALPRVKQLVKFCGFQAVQLSGDETQSYCRGIGVPVIKVIRMSNANVYKAFKGFQVAAYLLDSYNKNLYGGTGQNFEVPMGPKGGSKPAGPGFNSGRINPRQCPKGDPAVRRLRGGCVQRRGKPARCQRSHKVSHFIRARKKRSRGMRKDINLFMADQKSLIIKLAHIYYHTGSWDKAIMEYEKIIAMDPNDFNVHLTLGELYQKKGDLDRAYREFELSANGFLREKNIKKASAAFRELAGLMQKMVEPQDLDRAIRFIRTCWRNCPNPGSLDQLEGPLPAS